MKFDCVFRENFSRGRKVFFPDFPNPFLQVKEWFLRLNLIVRVKVTLVIYTRTVVCYKEFFFFVSYIPG